MRHAPTRSANSSVPPGPGRAGLGWPSARVRREAEELLDRPGQNPAELAENLRDIRRVNRLAGGTRVVMRHLPALLAAVPLEREAVVLDLATGSGDIPRAVVGWARRRRRPIRVVASDASAEILAAARRGAADYPEISWRRWDALAVPLADGAVDVVLCSLALHHFGPESAVRLLGEMARLGRHGFLLNDIRRSGPGYVAAWVSSRLATRNRLTRHDMPLSVLRAYTPGELAALLAEAGVGGAAVRRHPLFRMAAVKRSAVGGQPSAVSGSGAGECNDAAATSLKADG